MDPPGFKETFMRETLTNSFFTFHAAGQNYLIHIHFLEAVLTSQDWNGKFMEDTIGKEL